jgi:Holliday junction resolvase
MRRRGKVDDNQRAIVEALRKCGASVQSLAAVGHGVPDLLVGWAGRTWLVEVKHAKRGTLTPEQVEWHRDWRGVPVADIAEALEHVRWEEQSLRIRRSLFWQRSADALRATVRVRREPARRPP